MPKVGENLPKEASLAGLKRLKPMQQEFLNNYLHKDMTQTAAAREAGYKNPSVSAVRLLQEQRCARAPARDEARSTKQVRRHCGQVYSRSEKDQG